MVSLVLVLALITPAAEITRIQTHLATVDGELRAADVTRLSIPQRARRAALIKELAIYRARGVFPRNLELDRPTPFLIDDRGVRCAMAHLIETHGGAAFVTRIAASANNAYVRELAVDAALRAWLDHNGLTVDEAARIQPSYPKMSGQRCNGLSVCVNSTCEPAVDEPDLAFCSPSCDPATGACPIGVEGIAMECQARGDRHLCVYPLPTPGGTGWPCDPEDFLTQTCVYSCAPANDGSDRGQCVPACSGSRACPAAYACPPLDQGSADHLRSCGPIAKDGCSATAPTTSWVVLVGLLCIPMSRRRRPRARTAQ